MICWCVEILLVLIREFCVWLVDLASPPFFSSNFFFFPFGFGLFPKFFRPNPRSPSLCSWQNPDHRNFRSSPDIPAPGPSGLPRNLRTPDLPSCPELPASTESSHYFHNSAQFPPNFVPVLTIYHIYFRIPPPLPHNPTIFGPFRSPTQLLL